MMRESAEKFHRSLLRSIVCSAAAVITGCATPPAIRTESPPVPSPTPAGKSAAPAAVERAGSGTATAAASAIFSPARWSELPGWQEDDVAEAWKALLASCSLLTKHELWRDTCMKASHAGVIDAETARRFFEHHFTPYRVASADSDEGLITGYYEALLRGSRKPSARYRHPIYAVPDDLIVVDLGSVYPELKSMRLRGRLEGRRLVPYPDRALIESGHAPLHGREIVWVDDSLDLFFLHIQGSGRILLESGETIRVGYADQNGHPYRAIGRVLIDRGELTREEVSMQSIAAWVRANTERSAELLNSNPSYVFFRELPATAEGPPGSLGVPLTPGRSIAVDRRFIPLGAPVFISTNWPGSSRPLDRLTLAQDTGGAIRGAVRADFFWGSGEAAEREAGHMKERLRMWVLLPHGHPLPGATPSD